MEKIKKVIKSMLNRKIGICILLCLCCLGCQRKKNTYLIARDSNWHPYDFAIHTSGINGFVNQLTETIARKMKKELVILSLDNSVIAKEWLDKKKFDAVFITTEVTSELLERYDVSEPILMTGPVLVVRKNSSFRKVSDFSNKRVLAVTRSDNAIGIAAMVPGVIIRFYDEPIPALGQLIAGRYDGMLMPYIEARQMISKDFAKTLQIVTGPLNDSGIRLMTLKNYRKDLLEAFNIFIQKEDKKRFGRVNQLKKKFFLA